MFLIIVCRIRWIYRIEPSYQSQQTTNEQTNKKLTRTTVSVIVSIVDCGDIQLIQCIILRTTKSISMVNGENPSKFDSFFSFFLVLHVCDWLLHKSGTIFYSFGFGVQSSRNESIHQKCGTKHMYHLISLFARIFTGLKIIYILTLIYARRKKISPNFVCRGQIAVERVRIHQWPKPTDNNNNKLCVWSSTTLSTINTR